MSQIIDLDSRRTTEGSERTAPTERGETVISAVAEAARGLLIDRWVHELTIVEIARTAGVVRASLLLQYPGGLPDILETVLGRELEPFDESFFQAMGQKHASPTDRVMVCFERLFKRAEASGRLYANLRGAMFTWGAENTAMYRLALQDYVSATAELLTGGPAPADPRTARLQGFVAEGVFNALLNILADEGEEGRTWAERREAFRAIVSTAVVGLAQLSRKPRRSKPRPAAAKKRASR